MTLPLNPRLLQPVPIDPREATVSRVAEGVWRLRLPLPLPRVRSLNAFLLESDHGWTLVDCGMSVSALAHAVGLLALELSDIATLVITHPHSDHAAAAHDLATASGCEVVCGRGTYSVSDVLRNPSHPVDRRRALARDIGVPDADLDLIVEYRSAGFGSETPPIVGRYLSPGDQIRSRSGPWTIVPLPGHSATQVGLSNSRHRMLIGSDVVYPRTPPFLEWGSSPNPLADYIGSLDRVVALNPAVILPGHGRPDRDPGARITAAHNTLHALTCSIRGLVAVTPLSPYAIARELAGDDRNPDTTQSLLSTTMVVVEQLAADGMVGKIRGRTGELYIAAPVH